MTRLISDTCWLGMVLFSPNVTQQRGLEGLRQVRWYAGEGRVTVTELKCNT